MIQLKQTHEKEEKQNEQKLLLIFQEIQSSVKILSLVSDTDVYDIQLFFKKFKKSKNKEAKTTITTTKILK